MSQLDETPYRQPLVFRSATADGTAPEWIRITDLETPVPPTCLRLLERVPGGAS